MSKHNWYHTDYISNVYSHGGKLNRKQKKIFKRLPINAELELSNILSKQIVHQAATIFRNAAKSLKISLIK